jgi:hypothetical protein
MGHRHKKGKYQMISILLVAALAACIVYIVGSSESVDNQCGVDLTYQRNKKGKK